jgi:hypothetical protein
MTGDARMPGATLIEIGIRVEEAEVVERDHYCPADVPCIGRTGLRIAVPVRVVKSDDPAHPVGKVVSEARAIYCPGCRTIVTEQTRAAG